MNWSRGMGVGMLLLGEGHTRYVREVVCLRSFRVRIGAETFAGAVCCERGGYGLGRMRSLGRFGGGESWDGAMGGELIGECVRCQELERDASAMGLCGG